MIKILENFLKSKIFFFEDIKINFDQDKPVGYILIKDEKNRGFLGTIFKDN